MTWNAVFKLHLECANLENMPINRVALNLSSFLVFRLHKKNSNHSIDGIEWCDCISVHRIYVQMSFGKEISYFCLKWFPCAILLVNNFFFGKNPFQNCGELYSKLFSLKKTFFELYFIGNILSTHHTDYHGTFHKITVNRFIAQMSWSRLNIASFFILSYIELETSLQMWILIFLFLSFVFCEIYFFLSRQHRRLAPKCLNR